MIRLTLNGGKQVEEVAKWWNVTRETDYLGGRAQFPETILLRLASLFHYFADHFQQSIKTDRLHQMRIKPRLLAPLNIVFMPQSGDGNPLNRALCSKRFQQFMPGSVR